jgi:invasion protein IalB
MKERGLAKGEMLALADEEGLPRREVQAVLSGLEVANEPKEDLRFVYSPWVKFCESDKAIGGGRSCFVATEVRTQGGVPVMAASLMERDRQSKTVMRIKISGPLQLRYGARAIIDEDQLIRAAFFTCYANACMADFPIATELARKLRKARTLTIEAICLDGTAVSFHVPMTSFSRARGGRKAIRRTGERISCESGD